MILNKETKIISSVTTSHTPFSIPKSVQDLLVKQLAHELYNKFLYESFANFYNLKGLVVLEKYYRARANEEEHHYQWIKNYLAENDCEYQHPTPDEISEKWENNDLIKPFELTVEKENETTEQIYAIVDEAIKEKDYITLQWLMSDNAETGCLVKEQLEEMTLSRTVLDIAKMEGSWLRKEKSIMNIYNNDLD